MCQQANPYASGGGPARRVPEAEGRIERRQRYTEEQSSLQDGKQSHLMANAIRRGIAQRIIGLPDPVPRSVEPAVRCSRCMVRMSSSRSACTRARFSGWAPMVARDGAEPPRPAFSGLDTAVLISLNLFTFNIVSVHSPPILLGQDGTKGLGQKFIAPARPVCSRPAVVIPAQTADKFPA
jgi:hypothetical protein